MAAHPACAFFLDAEPALGAPSSLHALGACALCAKPLGRDADIFMYRGDTPFCSEDCRDEQMRLDATRAAARSGARRHRHSSGTEARRGHQENRKVSAVAS